MIKAISTYFTGAMHHGGNEGFRKSSFLFLVIVFTMFLQMPFVFAVKKSIIPEKALSEFNKQTTGERAVLAVDPAENNAMALAYDSMQLDKLGLSEKAFNYALQGFNHLLQQGRFSKDNIISIVDFSLPSYKKRLFVIDLDNYRVLFNTYVAHGVNSGRAFANQFSNTPSSYKSSLGFYQTLGTYIGQHGYSLKLNGLEKGINDNANSRAIVIHAAGYVDESLIRAQGYIGRSWGCPALPEKLHKPIIDKIKDGSCLFIYSTDVSYLKSSGIINGLHMRGNQYAG
jgi:hypothetical protein